jgi:predicted O-methyltransferase YrrM
MTADLVHASVRAYLASLAPDPGEAARLARERAVNDGVPAISADSARFLHVLATLLPATRAFELGTGYGLSALAVATAGVPGSVLFTVERDGARAAVARDHFERAGVADRINVMLGEATRLVHKVGGPFDLIVQDAEKSTYGPLLDRLVALLRPGGVLVSDNILWRGDVVPGFPAPRTHSQASIDAVAEYNRRLAADPRLRTAFLPIGDGLALSVRIEGPP